MKRSILSVIFALTLFSALAAQVPLATAVQIAKAEDARRYDAALETLMKSPNASVRTRAALAAGRIGDKSAVTTVAGLLRDDNDADVRAMAAFALGEIESVDAVEPILQAVKDVSSNDAIIGRLVEAIGKIVAANPKTEGLDSFKKIITDVLKEQIAKAKDRNASVVSLALTAALRTRPEGSETLVAKFLLDPDPRIRADAGNTLSRFRAKNANATLRDILQNDKDAVPRANAAKALGAADDKDSLELLVGKAIYDEDARVRVSAIRALGSLRETKPVERLISRGQALLKSMSEPASTSKELKLPVQTNELLEIATTLGRLLPNTENEDAIRFLKDLRLRTNGNFAETETALAKIGPKAYVASTMPAGFGYDSYRKASAYAQGLGTIAETKDDKLIAQAGQMLTGWVSGMALGVRPADQKKMMLAMPDITGSMVALKPDNLDEILRGQLENEDLFLRAAAAGAIADLPPNKENAEALSKAFASAMIRDKQYDDAQLAILDALAKVDKKAGVGTFIIALSSQDYLVRKKALDILDDQDLQKEFPGLPLTLENARNKHKDQVLPYSAAFGTKLGQVLNTDADYRRALSRKNGSVKAVFTTEKGMFTMDLFPEDAPLTVDNFIKLARARYFDGLEVHRVVPNFVVQDGDPRGDGNGGPGWSIRCEINTLPFDRGAVGMALSGKDTGGSQWFVTHSPQPHLDGGYTVFGHVSEEEMTVPDRIVRGDRILKVTIVEKTAVKKLR